MKRFIVLALILCATTAFAGVLGFSISVDQDTKMYFGTDLTNYILLPSGTFEKVYVTDKSQVVFAQTSSAKTSTPNVRMGFMNAVVIPGKPPRLATDADGQKLQGFRVDAVGNYYLTKQTTIPLNP